LLKAFTEIDDPNLKMIIAPHEIHENHLTDIKKYFLMLYGFQIITIRHLVTNEFAWSMLAKASNVLIIDNIGMLSRLYHYATITYIGGGFNKGIHNTLEAAVYGKPVLFGPNYKKFKEAIGLIETGGAVCVNSSADLTSQLKKLLTNKDVLEASSKNSFDFVKQNKGATEKILHYIEANRLLTN
jgi:3-deoxy-D-manno-octulosonic-acid transferase